VEKKHYIFRTGFYNVTFTKFPQGQFTHTGFVKSLADGVFPSVFKRTVVRPLLKKSPEEL